MKKLLFAAAALLSAPAFAASAQGPAPIFELGGAAGIVGLNLPSFNTGVLGHVAGGNLFGGMIGFNGEAVVGGSGDWNVVLGINAYGAFGAGETSWTDSITSLTTITGLDAPASTNSVSVGVGSVVLSTSGPGPKSSSMTISGGSIDRGQVTPDATGFNVASGAESTSTGAGFVGVGDATGGIFVGASTDGSLKLKTDVTRTVFYGGADLSLGMAGTFDSSTKVQVYAGPSIRALSQGITTALTADIVEVPTSPQTILPTFTIVVNDQLMSTYLGGVVGSKVSFQAAPGITFTLGAEGGAYAVHSSWNAHDTYSTCCGSDPSLGASPSLSVNGPTHTADLGSVAAFSAKANVGATWDLEGNKSIGVNGNIGYLSAVPTVNHTGLVGGTPSTTFGWGSMITYGLSATFTGHF